MNVTQEELMLVNSFERELNRDTESEIEKIAGLYPRGFISITASEAGTGKTWLMLYIACQLSLGGTILNGLAFDSKPMKIVIMSGETGTDLLDIRLGSANWQYNRQNIKVYNAIEMGIGGLPYLLNTPEGQRTIEIIATQNKPDILFFDTLISFHTCDESKQADMIQIYLFLARLAKRYNCAVVLNHHTRKQPTNNKHKEFTQDDVIGSSAGVRIANSVYLISPQREDQNIILVRNVKSWDKKIPPFTYTFTERDGYTDFEINLNVETFNHENNLFEKFIQKFENNALITVSETARELKITKRSARYYLEKFTETGQLEKIKNPFSNDITFKIIRKEESTS